MRKKYYYHYKRLGVCLSCMKNKAEAGKVFCAECAKKDLARVKSYDKARKSYYNKRKRSLCCAFGVCTDCMTKDQFHGQLCIVCYEKRKSSREKARSSR